MADPEKYAGVSIRQFPKETNHGDIIDFACRSGLPEEKKEEIIIKNNGVVTIRNIDNATSKLLIETIHGKLNFGKKLYCNGFIPLTPEKQDDGPPAGSPTSPASSPTSSPGSSSTNATNSASLPDINIGVLSPDFKDPSAVNLEQISPGTMVRRYSLSLLDRSPPGDSLAADILGSQTPSFIKTASILNELKTMSEQLSDFGSCISDSDEAVMKQWRTLGPLVDCKHQMRRKETRRRKES